MLQKKFSSSTFDTLNLNAKNDSKNINNLEFLKRNSIFFHDFNHILKFYLFFIKKIKFFFKKFNSKSSNFKFFFLSGSTDFWFTSVFDALAKDFSGFHIKWDSSKFYYFFKKIIKSSKEFFPIFIISPNLLVEQSFFSTSFLFSKYPQFMFFDISLLNKNLILNKNVFPLFFHKKNMFAFIIFWLKVLKTSI